MYLTRKLKLGKTDQLDRLARRAGDLWSTVAKWHWRFVDRQGYWLSKGQSQKMYCKDFDGLHSQSAQAVADSFYDSLQSWRKKRDNGKYEGLHPPYKQKRYFKVQWKPGAIKLRDDGVLRLSNGRGNDPVLIDWPSEKEPKRVEIGWDGDQYEVRCQYKVEGDEEPKGQKKAGVDLGERHLATVYVENGENISVHGGRLRSLRRQHNRTSSNLRSKIDRKEKGSRRWKRLVGAKDQQLTKIRNQIEDFLHKVTTRLVNTLHERRVGSVVVGDLTGIRERISYGSRMNQRLHQWAYSKFERMLTYKAQLRGMTVERASEAYTSQSCPNCGHRHKSSNRNFDCPSCSFEGHRDVVGARNILRKKYPGDDTRQPSVSTQVAGEMASPTGVRYHPHMWCNPATASKTCTEPNGSRRQAGRPVG
ncbi:RNA-guided endonuclease InsQ/TnpB family protein [Salinibacter ruber]|uniref:RNA-guided endonuclease InsQ/TnpB family protein n=1 Tax=Salinibacter ruber TaxID=146919 RepID=UPI0021675B66|nr:transposase [Salinibacter ruber]